MDINEVYQKLTGVDINAQTRIWDERGKGYYGEYLVFTEIYKCVPGCCKILMNLQIPSTTGGTTELDLVLIHETGFYVFEVKHYKGTIYGNIGDKRWTQYFRTAPNHTFNNPVEQNQYHIEALHRLFPYIPIYSYIVFTNKECDLRITGSGERIDIGTIYGLNSRLAYRFQQSPKMLSMDKIDDIFIKMLPYSPDSDKEVTYNEETMPFYKFVNNMKNYSESILLSQKAKLNKLSTQTILATVAMGLLVIISSIFIANVYISNERKECEQYCKVHREISKDFKDKYDELAQKFIKVEYLNDGNLIVRKDIATITECKLEQNTDLTNVLQCDMWIQVTSDNYGIQIPEDTKMIVILKNGHVQEYEFWGERYTYNEYSSRITKSKEPVKLLSQEFYNVKKEDISQIKMIGVILWKWENKILGKRENIISDMEIEIYNEQ